MKRICPKCTEEFEIPDDYKGYYKKFCSKSCANSRSHSTKIKKRISKTVKNTWHSKTEEGKQKALDALKRAAEKRSELALRRLMESNFEDLGHDSRRRRVFLEQDQKCNHCSISDWNGKPLSFELEHIDGNKFNNKRENLEILCPNCHSQTKTWRGRNNKNNASIVQK